LAPPAGASSAPAGADRDLAALLAALGRVDARLDLAKGVVALTATAEGSAAGDGRVEATLPLGGLTAIGVAPATLAAVVTPAAAGPLRLQVDLPHVEAAGVFRALGLDDRPESGGAALRAALEVDLGQPARARGELEVRDLQVETASPAAGVDPGADLAPAAAAEVHRLRALDPLRLTLADGIAVLAPARLEVDGRELTATATLGLDADWQFGAAPRTLVRRVAARARGELAAGALDPYLAGGAARGLLTFDVEAAGTLGALTATIAVDGSDASVFWPAPYPLRLAAPVVTASFAVGALTLDQVTATLNGGTVEVTGGRSAVGDLDLGMRLRDVAASLDYGLLARFGGDLHLVWPAQGRARLSGNVVVERAVLERDLDLDREVLLSLLTPPETPGTAASVLEDIDLELVVDTVDGVRIRNNVADLRAAWASPLAITGTAALPVIRGDIEVDPGGLVYAYGQVVRLDQARLRYTGNPAVDPIIEATTTSSLDDPTLVQSAERRPLDALAEQRARDETTSITGGEAARTDLAQRLESGLAGYFGERLMARLGERLGQVTLRPALIFTEADPSARLTVSRDVSRHASLALSLDLRNAERQTYRLDLHGFARLPRFTLQGFTTDEHEYGGTLQQALELGGSRQPVVSGPRVDHVRVHGQGVPRRALLRGFALRRGDALPPGRTLDLEVAAVDVMRERGFPDAQATVVTTPSGRRGREGQAAVDVAVTVDPGLATTFQFAGSPPSRAARASLIGLYRGDVFEPAARLEMVAQARRYWRGRGYPQPQVTVEVERGLLGARPWFGARWLGSRPRCQAAVAAAGAATACRLVTVTSRPGEARVIRELAVQGIDDPEAATALAARFAGTLERVELLAGVPDARQRATSTLARLGYPQATLGDVSLDAAGRLTLAVDSGLREEVAEVAISGLPSTATELAAGIDLVVGEPALRDRISRQAAVLTAALRRSGYADARVSVDLAPAGTGVGDRPGLAVHYAVDPGRLVAIADVVFVGQRHTPEARLRRVAGLEAGAIYDPAAVDRARRALHRLGLFSRVTLREDRRSDGSRELRFAVLEEPRWSIAYGARWESDRGVAGVVDVADHNLLGRGATVGLRLLYEQEDQSVRAYAEVPRVFGSQAELELYGEARHREQPDANVVEDWEEITLQLSHGFGAHGTLRVYGRNRDTRINELVPDPFFPSFEIQIINRFVGLQGIWDSRDTPLLAARGNFASLDVSGSGDALGSDLSYLRTYMQWNVYRPAGSLAGFPVVWGQSLRFGLAEPFGGQELVRDVRFFAGGPYSVRGYATDSLGPQEDLGTVSQPTGGGAVLVINEELRLGLPAGLWGVFFVDAGQVWSDRAAVDTDLAKSVGLGLRAQLPIGIVRGDLAWPLDRRPGDDAYRFYFGFGSSF
jgi:outer membrane protein assembly factor BamA